jgi:hypothetical protein
MVNLSALRDRARALSGIRLQTLRSDEQVDEVINEAYQEVINLSQWSFLRASQQVNLPVGANSFETPLGFSEVVSVSYTNDGGDTVRLQSTVVDEIDRLRDEESAEPFLYARVNDKEFLLWPTPNVNLTLTIRGKQTVQPLKRDSDVPVFDDQFHPMLAYRAASRMLAEEGDDSGRAEFYQQEANVFFARMQQFYTRTPDSSFFVMGGRRRRRANEY